MGKASRQKRERRREVIAPMPPSLILPSGEPLQAVRLCYTVVDRVAAMDAISKLGCIRPDRRDDDLFSWYSDHEAAALRFGGTRPPGSYLLGTVRFPDPFDLKGMIAIETHSIERALAAAAFFAPRLPEECRLTRCRLVNLHFPAEALTARGGVEGLMDVLEEVGVGVTDPRRDDARLQRDLARAQGPKERERILAARLQSIREAQDLPTVEDFALFPEEAAPPFEALSLTLRLRLIRTLRISGGASDEQMAVMIRDLADGVLR
jgi:hypothetical protein